MGNKILDGDGRDQRDGSTFRGLFTIAYPGCIEGSVSFLPILERCSTESAAKIVFCITSWHQNRSLQSCCLSLNAALLQCSGTDGEDVVTYEEFASAFEELRGAAHISPMEDPVLPVMGQTRLAFHGRWWRALYGCGLTREYPRLCFADALCGAAGKTEEFERLLGYVESMTLALGGTECDCEAKISPGLQRPSRGHWEQIGAWFAGIEARGISLSDDVISALSKASAPVECRHLIRSGSHWLPLFNPSILYDYLKEISEGIDVGRRRAAVDRVLRLQARESFPVIGSGRSGHIALPCFRVDGKFVENCPGTVLVFDDTPSVTLFFNLADGEGNLKALKDIFAKRTEPLEILVPPLRGGRARALCLSNPSECKFNIVAYADDVLPDLAQVMVERSEIADVTCGATDVMTLLQIASSPEESNAFFQWVKAANCQYKPLFSGYSDLFCSWRDGRRQVAPGAEDADGLLNIYCDYNETDAYYIRLFSEFLDDYPLVEDKYVLGSPFAYSFGHNDRGFLTGILKSGDKSVATCLGLGGDPTSYVCLCVEPSSFDGLSLDELEGEARVQPLVEDVFMLLVKDLRHEFADAARSLGGLLRIVYLAERGADKWGLRPINCRLGVKGALRNGADGFPAVALAIDGEIFLEALSSASDRSVECDLAAAVLSLFSARPSGPLRMLLTAIKALRFGEKKVDAAQLVLPFVWHMTGSQSDREVSRAWAIKKVALAANRCDVQPGVYSGKEGRDLLRSFRTALFEDLKSELGKYDQRKLVISLYEWLADSLSEFYVRTGYFGEFSKVERAELARVRESSLEEREEARAEARAARCCIETVLGFGIGGPEIPEPSDIASLINLAIQYLALNDSSGMLSFDPKGVSVEISPNCTARMIEDDGVVSESRVLRMRQLLDGGHRGSSVTKDEEYIARAKAAFESDTGVSFDCFTSVLDVLALGVEDALGRYVAPNVVAMDREAIVEFSTSRLGDSFSEQELADCVARLELDVDDIVQVDGAYIPFSNTKGRPNRLELRPIVVLNGELVFSPVAMGVLRMRWARGIAERFIPAKNAFPELDCVMKEWKSLYEKALEGDARDCFLSHGFNPKHVYKSLKLHRHGNHPAKLGDYDVFAYDAARGVVWVIECKEYIKVDSAYDYMQQQQQWFGRGGDLEKFERRIEYVRENLMSVLVDLAIFPSEAPEIIPLLVCNKLFMNLLGESSFEVVTLDELSARLSR